MLSQKEATGWKNKEFQNSEQGQWREQSQTSAHGRTGAVRRYFLVKLIFKASYVPSYLVLNRHSSFLIDKIIALTAKKLGDELLLWSFWPIGSGWPERNVSSWNAENANPHSGLRITTKALSHTEDRVVMEVMKHSGVHKGSSTLKAGLAQTLPKESSQMLIYQHDLRNVKELKVCRHTNDTELWGDAFQFRNNRRLI